MNLTPRQCWTEKQESSFSEEKEAKILCSDASRQAEDDEILFAKVLWFFLSRKNVLPSEAAQRKGVGGFITASRLIYSRLVRWSRLGVFARIFAAPAARDGPPGRLMIDATHLKAHRTSASLLQKGGPAISAAPEAG